MLAVRDLAVLGLLRARGARQRDAAPDVVVSDCTLSGLRIAKENQVKVLHPALARARAYGLIPAEPAAPAVSTEPAP